MAVSHIKSDTIADFTGTITGFNSQGSTTTIAATDLVRPSDWNSAHNQFYTLSGNTTNASTASGTNVVFGATGGLTLSGATGTIWFSAPAERKISFWPAFPMDLATSSMVSGTTAATGGSTQTTVHGYLAPLIIDDDVHFNRVVATVSGGTAAGTGSWTAGHMFGLYTLNASTAFSLLSSFVWNAFFSQNSVSAISMHFYWGTNSAANSASFGGNSSASYTGNKQILISSGANTLTNGSYYLVHAFTHRTSNASVGGINSAQFISASQTTGGSSFGSTVNVGNWLNHMGSFSTTSNANTERVVVLPGSIHTSALTYTGGSSQIRWPIIGMASSL
jgi:hypothetical protein